MSTTYVVSPVDGLPHIGKDPDARLPYSWNWTQWLADAGETGVASATVTLESGIDKYGAHSIADGVVTQLIEGGDVGTAYVASCRIVSAPSGFIDERSIVIDVLER